MPQHQRYAALSQLLNICRLFALFGMMSMPAVAAVNNSLAREFSAIYEREWQTIKPCIEQLANERKVCSEKLRSDGNAPFVLYPDSPKATIVLFHGLGDSPFYVRSIAEHLYRQGYLVIAPLTPGHGLGDADTDMQDPALKQRWYQHVDDIMTLANTTHDQVMVGGYSAGGALATHYVLKNWSRENSLQKTDMVKGLLLFSGALQLSSNAETMSDIWGMKTLAAWLDGTFQTQGPNPYKYPKVASYSGLVLMDVINDIRQLLNQQNDEEAINMPIFAAHSLADNTTLYAGVENLLNKVKGDHTLFKIDKEFDVCSADVVMNTTQLITMKFEKSMVNRSERCAVPKANPLHQSMLSVLSYFIAQHVSASEKKPK